MEHYDHHRILMGGETETRAQIFERAHVEKFMESVEEDEDGNVQREKVGVYRK